MTDKVQELFDSIEGMKKKHTEFYAQFETMKPTIDVLEPVAKAYVKEQTRDAVIQELEDEGHTVVTKKPKYKSVSMQGAVGASLAALYAFVEAWQGSDVDLIVSTGAALITAFYGVYGAWRRGDLS